MNGSISIKVFSHAGSFLRCFDLGDTPACADTPDLCCHYDGRLYLCYINSCIVVLTVEGERLQVWRPDADRRLRDVFGIYDRKLLIETCDADDGNRNVRLEALQGI